MNNKTTLPTAEMIKSKEQIAGIRKAGEINTRILDYVSEHIKVGMSTEEVNTLVHNKTIELGGIPAPLGYEGFPKSTCTSVNEVVCHGIPTSTEILKDGDIINVDVTTIYNGFYGDASRMFPIGDVDEKGQILVNVAKECLELGVQASRAGGYLGDIGAVIQEHARKHGFSVVEDIGGHGVGVDFHEDPFVSHVGERGTGVQLAPGMIFTIEPMINEGVPYFNIDDKTGWIITTADKKRSAQWEYTILITDGDPEILTY